MTLTHRLSLVPHTYPTSGVSDRHGGVEPLESEGKNLSSDLDRKSLSTNVHLCAQCTYVEDRSSFVRDGCVRRENRSRRETPLSLS